MLLYTVWKDNTLGIKERCIMNQNGNYVGIKTGKTYSNLEYSASKQYAAQIVDVDSINNTGMYHLNEGWEFEGRIEENKKSWKQKFIGCFVTIEKAHIYGELIVYRCLELNEYFSSNEIKILD